MKLLDFRKLLQLASIYRFFKTYINNQLTYKTRRLEIHFKLGFFFLKCLEYFMNINRNRNKKNIYTSLLQGGNRNFKRIIKN